MQVFHSLDQAYQFVFQQRAAGRSVGMVPTMGALHEGHLSLARRSAEMCDVTVATIFINPTQFSPNDDLDRYPRTLDEDCRQLDAEHVQAVFVPAAEAIYPPGFSTFVQPPEIAMPLEGACRPGHFRGVTTIVMKLFQILPASHAFFGQKDYQQLKVIEAMAHDLNVPVKIVPCPIVREADGLAMSSRNRYLNDADRQRALLLYRALTAAQELSGNGQPTGQQLETEMRRILTAVGRHNQGVDKIDYATVANRDSLSPTDVVDGKAIALIAAYVGSTRLIDNLLLSGDG